VISERERDFRGSFSGYERDRLFYHPNGRFKKFVQSAYVFGLDYDHDGRAAAAVDIDGDGDLDLVELTAQGLRLFENTSPPRHFARVRLSAARSRPALGAVVKLTAGGVVRQDFVKATEGFRAQVPSDLHFGLGDTKTIERVEVRWPSGKVEVWKDLVADQLLLIREGVPAVETQPLLQWAESTRPGVTGAPSSSFVAQRLDGDSAPLAGGRPTVVNFWAPWCAPCNVELPQLVNLASRYGKDVDFVGVSVEMKDLDSVRASIRKFNIPYAQFLGSDAVMQQFFGGSDQAALPSTFVFDRGGRLRRLVRGAITETDLDRLLQSFQDESLRPADLTLLARLSFQTGDYEKAGDYYRRLADLEPDSVEQAGVAWEHRRAQARFSLGVAHLRAGRAAQAVGELQGALGVLGEDQVVLLQLGLAATDAGQLDVAADALQRAVRVKPDFATAWLYKARVHRARGETEEARESYTRALLLDPANESARRELGGLGTVAPRR
jgi:thiol-disulfide isomerase/thioredoxin/Flp pilus assembly protein TadD